MYEKFVDDVNVRRKFTWCEEAEKCAKLFSNLQKKRALQR